MKTLRIVRNIAALFILMMASLALQPRGGVAHAALKACLVKTGFNCIIAANGGCTEQRCTGAPCEDLGCRHFTGPF